MKNHTTFNSLFHYASLFASASEDDIPETLKVPEVFQYHDRDTPVIITESPPNTRAKFRENLTTSDIKTLILHFNEIFLAARDASDVLKLMKQDAIFNPHNGIDYYVREIWDKLSDIESMIGQPMV